MHATCGKAFLNVQSGPTTNGSASERTCEWRRTKSWGLGEAPFAEKTTRRRTCTDGCASLFQPKTATIFLYRFCTDDENVDSCLAETHEIAEVQRIGDNSEHPPVMLRATLRKMPARSDVPTSRTPLQPLRMSAATTERELKKIVYTSRFVRVILAQGPC